jgi:chromosomal replication initiator protein
MASPISESIRKSRSGADRFLLLNENRFAHAAVEQLTWQEASSRPRQVFLSGPAGCGKSVLARWFVRLELSKRPDVSSVHITASEFGAEFAEASESGVIPAFQERYRALKSLVVEDLRSLGKRTETLTQLMFVIDNVLANGGRVLLTSRCPPGELTGMPSRLVNRFHAGVSVGIQSPCNASRVSLLQYFAETRQIPIPYESICLLARDMPVSARELLATIIQLDHYARHSGSTLDPSEVRQYLDAEIKPTPPTLAQITRATARQFLTTTGELRGHSRKQFLILPRQCALYLSRSLTGLPLVRIGEYFGKRHHSTVAHACERIAQLVNEQPDVRQHLAQIGNLLSD